MDINAPGVFSKYIESTNPRNERVIDASSELSQVPKTTNDFKYHNWI